jgi:IS4 transposase
MLCFEVAIRVTSGDVHDVNILDQIIPQPGAYYVMDRGYLDYSRLYRIHLAGAFFVTRAKSNLDACRIYSRPTDKQTGVLADQSIALNGYGSREDYPSHLRRIRFRDPDTGKHLVFLTNQFTLPTATICALYKSRWQIELFFKWIKQHLRIKAFYGTSENAAKPKSGSPSRPTCWSPSSRSASISPARSALCCESSQLPCSRKCPFHRHFSRRTAQVRS